MTTKQWTVFCQFKKDFRDFCDGAKSFNKNETLTSLQKNVALENGVPEYSLETNVVYNEDLELFTQESEIKAILVADNPGKNEQLAKNRRYLIGQAGKLADKFFRENPELKIDFRKNVLILNKSPLHTAKTALLKKLLSSFEKETGSKELHNFFVKSQSFMGTNAFNLQKVFGCNLWVVGYGELGEKKIFEEYWKTLKELYADDMEKKLFCFQHFSMNRFTINLKQNYEPSLSLQENLKLLGEKHRKRIFDF